MKILLAYISVTGGKVTLDFAARFASSYQLFPPGIDHETVIVGNGGPPAYQTGIMMEAAGIERLIFYPRSNDGWDIGAYLEVSQTFECDMLVCLGESVHFHRAGWLKRMAEAWTKHGPGMYGFWSSNLVRPHLNTTGFVIDPKLLAGYPNNIKTRADRYAFEHGAQPFWQRVASVSRPVMLVTWDGEWGPHEWRRPPNILWRGNQSNCLAFCTHTDNFAKAEPAMKLKWQAGADRV